MDGGCFVRDHHIQIRHLSKLNFEQPLLKFILYMEQDNVSIYDFFYGTSQKLLFVMLPFSLHFTSMMWLGMRSDGRFECWKQNLVQWAQEYIINVTHYGCWSSRFVHLPRFWISKILPCDVIILCQSKLH
jgi:hypothetical protein